MSDWKKIEPGESWNFKEEGKGAEFMGVYLSKEENVGENNSILYNFETDEGFKTVWGSTVIDIRMKNVKPGEEVKIVYLGQLPSQKRKGKTYHNFDVYHREIPMTKISDEDQSLIDEADKALE